MARFDAHEVAKEILTHVAAVVTAVKRHDADLARQLKRAAQSILLNVGEGNRRVGADRLHSFRVAAGSAGETLDAISIAEAWGYLASESTRALRELLDRELAMLWRLTEHRR